MALLSSHEKWVKGSVQSWMWEISQGTCVLTPNNKQTKNDGDE